ncbi:glycosyl hydrolase [Sandaracinobacter neustonicus]|uniref:Endoglucanase n=1 Tax=Sandaracinobacter neustonicus TaxID=1715348 RepID=A0A501XPR7_9SPHN|nr:glycoside hydrolase family 9 protein [Sandaracinobacter neustonicus]TPE62702.1 glycosyl hydrolase [Sandaracinobacter neustonicus]
MRAALIALLLAAPAAAEVSIDLNQTGFEPGEPRMALLRGAGDAPLAWELIDEAGQVRLSGKSLPLGADAAAGQRLQRIEFGGAVPDGRYRLRAGGASSPAFAIAPGLNGPLARDALRYFYHNRSAEPIEARFAGGERWARPAGHPRELVGCFAGTDGRGNKWPGCNWTLDATGGWYDAGDHGKYVVNGGISLWTLLNLHELLPAAFADGSIPIPEAGNGVNDLLDEARVQMEWMLRMQVPDGKRMQLPVNQRDGTKPLKFEMVDAGGMAHHKLADERWTKLPLRPDQDREKRFLYPPSTAATLNLAATAAQCARVWKDIDPAFSARCLSAAERAWDAARRNPAIYAMWDFPGSGGYDDDDVSDEFYWAAAELFTTTGAARYRQALLHSPHVARITEAPGWPDTAPLGTMTLALIPNGLDAAQTGRMRAAIVQAADRFAAERASNGYAVPFKGTRYSWGSNAVLLNRALLMGAANRIDGDPRRLAPMRDVLDYLLGRNPMGTSYVSGYGERAMRNPHHRFWAHSLDPAFPPPPPGVLSGGPNNRAMSDDVAKPMQGHCAAQTCWADDAQAFTLNEVTINWNAPLVWVSAYVDTAGRRP